MDTIAKLERLLKRSQDVNAAKKQAERNSVVDREEAARLMGEVLTLMPMKELKARLNEHLDISWAMLWRIKYGERKMNPEVCRALIAILKAGNHE